MKLIKRLNQITDKDRVTTELDILIYEKKIIWYLVEQTKFDDGDQFTEDQSYEDYIKNGPPSFAADLSDEKIKEIDRIIKQKKFTEHS